MSEVTTYWAAVFEYEVRILECTNGHLPKSSHVPSQLSTTARYLSLIAQIIIQDILEANGVFQIMIWPDSASRGRALERTNLASRSHRPANMPPPSPFFEELICQAPSKRVAKISCARNATIYGLAMSRHSIGFANDATRC